MHRARVAGQLQTTAHVAAADELEHPPAPLVALAAVLGQDDRVGTDDQRAEGAAGVDLGQLMVVADQHDRGTGGAGVLDQGVQVAGRQHARLVDDDHVAR